MAFGIDDAVAGVSNLLNNLIDKAWPNPEDKAKAEAIAMQAASSAELGKLKTQMSLALAEAQSGDKWTSRARPSFMYVMYIMILWSIPMGILSAFYPKTAVAIAAGMQAWLAAIPVDMWQVFGWCFGAYALGRSGEKVFNTIVRTRGK